MSAEPVKPLLASFSKHTLSTLQMIFIVASADCAAATYASCQRELLFKILFDFIECGSLLAHLFFRFQRERPFKPSKQQFKFRN